MLTNRDTFTRRKLNVSDFNVFRRLTSPIPVLLQARSEQNLISCVFEGGRPRSAILLHARNDKSPFHGFLETRRQPFAILLHTGNGMSPILLVLEG